MGLSVVGETVATLIAISERVGEFGFPEEFINVPAAIHIPAIRRLSSAGGTQSCSARLLHMGRAMPSRAWREDDGRWGKAGETNAKR